MADLNIWSDDSKVIQLATNDPDTLKDQIKKFLKHLFPKSMNSDSNINEVSNSLNEFIQLIEKISNKPECSAFLEYTLDLIVGHSIIREIFLKSSYFNTDIRLKLIQLFSLICSHRNEYCKKNNIVDFIFSSYKATLAVEDQILLQLLSILELNGLNFQKYYPFIWSENAALFYAAKHSQKLPFLRSPNIDEMFKDFNGRYLQNSLYYFPIDISMSDKPIEVIKGIEFWERYDPRFILPMLYHFISVQSIVKYHKFISYGCLSYVIVSLSSQCHKIRNIAYRILSRLYNHLDCANYPQDRQLWIGFIDYIRSGLNETNQRIDCTHTVLFSKIIEVLLNATSLLFPTIRNYLISEQKKPINYKSIPIIYKNCFFEISGTNQISYMLHQKFVMNWMKDSLRTESDVDMWQKINAFSDILTYYNSSLCCPENKPLIMQILINLSKLYGGVKVLCHHFAIFSWINHQLIIRPQYECNYVAPKDSLYKLVVGIWNTTYQEFEKTSNESSSFIFYETFCFELIMILSKIIYKVTHNSRVDTYKDICRKALKHTKEENHRKIIKTIICCNLPENLWQTDREEPMDYN